MRLFTIEQDQDDAIHLKCPWCEAVDQLSLVDMAGGLNEIENIELSDADVDYDAFYTASCRSDSDDPDWEPGAYACRACGSREVDQPENFEIIEWFFKDD